MPLIVFEGIDGCGKTTQVERLCARLNKDGIPPRRLREPGGTALGEVVREILLDPATNACPVAELFGYLQARAQLCEEVLRPALAAGEVVILDRFYHSTLAYQAYGLGLDPQLVRSAITLAIGNIHPDAVIWLELDPQLAQARREAVRVNDRIEARGARYQSRVHDGYRQLAEAGEMQRFDARLSAEALETHIWQFVSPLLIPDKNAGKQKPS